jgi:RNA polymerase sigma-70 factor (sigma-E family)
MTARDEDSFRNFVLQWWSPLTRTAFLLTGDRGYAEDLVQAALEKTHRKWSRVAAMESPQAYVRKAMVHTAVSWRRRRRVAEVTLLGTDTTVTNDEYVRIEQRQQIVAALRRLPPKMRAVLVLRYFEDLSEQDIADTLGCSVGTVKSQASRGLDRLRAELSSASPNVSAAFLGSIR